MKFYVQEIQLDKISGVIRAEGPGVLGDLFWECLPEQSCFGYSFEELEELGFGSFPIKKISPAK